jgi:hypothetical protein
VRPVGARAPGAGTCGGEESHTPVCAFDTGWLRPHPTPPVQDQVKIHKWDEQSYYSLKASAEKSHSVLHRLVCEYDEALAAPVAGLLDAELENVGRGVTPAVLITSASAPFAPPEVGVLVNGECLRHSHPGVSTPSQTESEFLCACKHVAEAPVSCVC